MVVSTHYGHQDFFPASVPVHLARLGEVPAQTDICRFGSSLCSMKRYVCSHPRVPRAHQAGLSRCSLAGVGLSESVRCHGPGTALLINSGVLQQQK
ncbi:hypothetical protein TNCV_3037341 [Trichonephila clavipes]|nr:hypothetical protein TNCV_3037341 [Trichonephila clavipes]